MCDLPQDVSHAPVGRATCSSDARELRERGISLLVGVLSPPANSLQREAIRESWMRWESVGTSVLVCFVIGRLHVPPATLARADRESTERRDILWLPNTADGCYLTVSKIHDFWLAASARLSPANASRGSGLQHVAKVDEDSFLHLPNLQADLRRLSCAGHVHLYYGGGAWAGYHPTKHVMCGFSWRGGGAYARYGCAKSGAHPAFPFVMGGLQVLSARLVGHIASSRAVHQYVSSSEPSIDYALLARESKRTINDDVMLGFWLSDAQLRRGLANVSYAFINARATNLECDLNDCAAHRICGYYKLPSNSSVLIHNLKSALLLPYVWGVIRGAAQHNSTVCKRFRDARWRLKTARDLRPALRWIGQRPLRPSM